MADLRTDFVDDVLDTTQNLSRVYNIKNRDGSIVQADVMIEDISVYSQTGSTFGATQINETNQAVNELNTNLNNMVDTKYDDVSGKPMWKDKGADTWNFFKSDMIVEKIFENMYVYTTPYSQPIDIEGQAYLVYWGTVPYNEEYPLYINDIRQTPIFRGNVAITVRGGLCQIYKVELKKGDVVKITGNGSGHDINGSLVAIH